MIDLFSQARILRTVILLLVFGSLVLVAINLSTQSNRKTRSGKKFGDRGKSSATGEKVRRPGKKFGDRGEKFGDRGEKFGDR